jgi:sec-independent protein translocase protein TatB
MFEVGFQEIVLIALLALIVLGPEKLPKLAAQLGQWTGRARSMARNLRQQLEQEVSYDDLLKQKQAAEEALRKANAAPMDFHHDVAASINPEPAATPPAEPAPELAPHAGTSVPAAATQGAATDPAK